jgi:hypothetical protein
MCAEFIPKRSRLISSASLPAGLRTKPCGGRLGLRLPAIAQRRGRDSNDEIGLKGQSTAIQPFPGTVIEFPWGKFTFCSTTVWEDELGWERRRNGRQYYYRVQRIRDRVVKTYIGHGEKGLKAAEEDAIERQNQALAAERCNEPSLVELATYLGEFDRLVDQLVTRQLAAAGYRLHHREWRPPTNGSRMRNNQTA